MDKTELIFKMYCEYINKFTMTDKSSLSNQDIMELYLNCVCTINALEDTLIRLEINNTQSKELYLDAKEILKVAYIKSMGYDGNTYQH